MEIHLEFDEPFEGIVFAEKHYQQQACRWLGNSSRSLAITIPTPTTTSTTSCGVSLEQSTGELSTSLIVSPLAGLLVSGVTSMQVRCLYIVNDITVTLSPLQVVNADTDADIVTGNGGTPTLLMQILDGHGIDGQPVTQASVGQRLTLDLVLKNTAIYDFYAYSCFAHDGSNSHDASLQIIDANGCGVRLARAIDVPVYVSERAGAAKHVYIHMYGFQFTSSQFVHFECQARPCVHKCKRKQCDETRSDNEIARKRRAEHDTEVTQLRLQTVLQMKPQAPEYAQLRSASWTSCRPTLPLVTLVVVIGLAAACGLILTYALFLVRRRKGRGVDGTQSEISSSISQAYSEPSYSVTTVWHNSKY
ncbi:unnamed protein product [Toxocara canis]|uniref:ZP domain-containing protein n=1 Tax=Toxocara canis TaxID=6265 RepID=A0A183UJF4_TOXCA|nr:unnamed protein product [Toxocara canis]